MALIQSLVCDGYPDCPYGEDELNCPTGGDNIGGSNFGGGNIGGGNIGGGNIGGGNIGGGNIGGSSNILELTDANFDKTVLSHPR
jgi:hypothetical protein